MPITVEQRRERQKYLCASDSPIILGLSPYRRTPRDVYFSKVYDLDEDDKPTESMSTGNYLEGPLLDWASTQLGGVQLDRQPWYVCRQGPAKDVFAAHLDAVIVGKRAGVEAKYCNAAMSQDYGDEGTDSIPGHVIVQAQHQMLAAELDEVWVAVAMAGFSLVFKLFHVPRDNELVEEIVRRGMEWWQKHVVAKCPPQVYSCPACQKSFWDVPGTQRCPACGSSDVVSGGDDTPPLEILKRIRREPKLVVDLPPEAEQLVFEYQQLGYQTKENEGGRDELKGRIIHLLGDAEGGRLPDGRMITFMEQRSAPSTNTTLLKAEHPELYDRYVTQGTHRSLGIKDVKKGKGAGFDKLVA